MDVSSMNTITRIKKEIDRLEVEAEKMVPFQRIHIKMGSRGELPLATTP